MAMVNIAASLARSEARSLGLVQRLTAAQC